MATVRQGNLSALLVVDVQNGVVATAWDRDRIIGNVAQAVARARGASVPVIWVQHDDDQLVRGSDAWAFVPELAPRDGDITIPKRFNSAFERTELEPVLSRLGVSHLVLAGAATNWCVRATAYAALDRGYDLTLLEDAHTTDPLEFPNGRYIDAQDIVDDLNVAMRWLEYPGRTNGVATVAEVDFSVAGGTLQQ